MLNVTEGLRHSATTGLPVVSPIPKPALVLSTQKILILKRLK